MRSKWMFYATVVLVLTLTLFVFYRTVSALNTVWRLHKTQKVVSVLDGVTTLADRAGEEGFESARFYGVKGVNYMDQLSIARKELDGAVDALRTRIESDGDSLVSPAALEAFSQSLKQTRRDVDTLNRAYQKQFGHPNGREPMMELLHAITPQEGGWVTPQIDREIYAGIEALHATKRLEDERALLAFFLARRVPLQTDHLLTWDAILEGKLLPKVSTGEEVGRLMETIAAIEIDPDIRPKLKAIREDLFAHIRDGDFTTQLYTLGRTFDAPLRRMYRATHDALLSLNRQLKDQEQQQRRLMLQYLILGLLMAGALFLLYRYLRTMQREKQALEESLMEIAGDLSAPRRRELVEIIDRGDRAGIYRFLAQTTMEARAAEDRAVQAERAKDLFLANMSHEIRTPLNGILGFTQLMQSTPLNPEQREFMGVIQGSSDNLLKIVNDILDLSKINADKIELESIPFSIVQHAEQAIEPHAARALEEGIDYSTFIDPTLPRIHSDPTKLTQVLTNLIGNAIKFTSEGGTVDVDVRKIKESEDFVTIRFSVRDSGVGISPEQKAKIFEPFSQADVSTTREFGGTGLGLTISREIISLMGGHLELESEVGKGSEFYFELIFKRAGEDEEIQNRLEGLHLAYYHAGQSILQPMERNLALYARASGARFRMLGDRELDLLEEDEWLLLDYSNRETRINIEKLLWLGQRTILLSTAAQKHETDNLSSRVERIIYRPLTATKLIRACLPEEEVPDAEADERARAMAMALEGLKILIAEDNPINQKLISRVLEGMGIETVMVDNGKEAVEMRAAQRFDAILMDIQMPVMGGVEAVKAILQYEHDHGAEHVPVIALTANALQGDRERYLKEGFDDYISKPVNIDQLRHSLKTQCSKHRYTPDLPEIPPAPSREGYLDLELGHPKYTVLMYSRSNQLMERLHHDALTYAGHTFDVVSNEGDLLNRLDEQSPDFLLIDTCSIDLESCYLVEAVRDNGIGIFLYGLHDADHGCEANETEKYTSVAMLLAALKKVKGVQKHDETN